MLELTGNVKLRYFGLLERFIRIRCLETEQIEKLVAGINFKDRRSYVQFVINTMVVDYTDKLLPELISGTHSTRELPACEEQLFKLCVDVNPALDIDTVSRFMTSDEAPSPLVFFEPHREPAEAMRISRERLLALEEELRTRIIGQDDAVKAVADAVRKAYVGFREEDKPVGNFLFVGPTGVGKTELAKTLARSLFSEGQGLVRIDCSEYGSSHEYAKLIGSPPGYVGHEQGGQLTEAVRRRPHTVVLFDEIEKADDRLHHVLLQILDDGRLTDGKGSPVSFRDAIIILTSNVGTRELEALSMAMGFGPPCVSDTARRATSTKAIDRVFRPEFINRIDEVVLFRTFTADESRRVVVIMLEDVRRRLLARGITVLFGDEVVAFLAERGISSRFGARPLRRAIKRYVESPLAGYVLSRGIETGTIEASVQGEALSFN